MSIKVFNENFFNFDILRLNPLNFLFKMVNFLIGYKTNLIINMCIFSIFFNINMLFVGFLENFEVSLQIIVGFFNKIFLSS